jgi:hypothetical protein
MSDDIAAEKAEREQGNWERLNEQLEKLSKGK